MQNLYAVFYVNMSWFLQVTKQIEELIALKPANHDFIKKI